MEVLVVLLGLFMMYVLLIIAMMGLTLIVFFVSEKVKIFKRASDAMVWCVGLLVKPLEWVKLK